VRNKASAEFLLCFFLSSKIVSVYILYSKNSDQYYIGSTKDLEKRVNYHLIKEFKNSFTSKYSAWELYFSMDGINNTVARKIEAHIKKMKSKKYLLNLKIYPEIIQKLILKYSIDTQSR
jgi:putative endonuclease